MICSRFGILFYFREKRLLLLEKKKESAKVPNASPIENDSM